MFVARTFFGSIYHVFATANKVHIVWCAAILVTMLLLPIPFAKRCICKDCQKEWLLFDLSKHGFEGFLWHEGAEVPDSELEKYHCRKCSSEYLEITIDLLCADCGEEIKNWVSLELS